MRYKKILSVICTTVFLVCLCAHALADDAEVSITAPQNGAVVDDEFDTITFFAEAGKKAVVIIDGEEIAFVTSVGNNTITLESKLYMGTHKITVSTYDADSSACASVDFTVVKKMSSTNIYSTFDGGMDSSVVASGTTVLGKNATGANVMIEARAMEGSDGEANGAIGYYSGEECTSRSLAETTGIFYMYNKLSKFTWKGEVTIEYDLRLYNPGAFEIETKNSSGAFSTIGGVKLFGANGRISGTSYEYAKNKWMHVKHILNLDNEKENVYIDDEAVIQNRSTGSALNGLTQVKFQYYATRLGANQGFAIDNVYAQCVNTYNGINSVEYSQDGINFSSAQNDVISQNTKQIKLITDVPIPANTELTDCVNFNVNGMKKIIDSASIDEKGNIIVQLPREVGPQNEIVLTIEAYGYNMHRCVKTDYSGIGINDIKCFSGNKQIFTERQLGAAQSLDVKFSLNNTGNASGNCCIVTVVYEGNRPICIGATNVIAAPNANEQEETVTISLPDTEGKLGIECYALDNMIDRTALSCVQRLN